MDIGLDKCKWRLCLTSNTSFKCELDIKEPAAVHYNLFYGGGVIQFAYLKEYLVIIIQ